MQSASERMHPVYSPRVRVELEQDHLHEIIGDRRQNAEKIVWVGFSDGTDQGDGRDRACR